MTSRSDGSTRLSAPCSVPPPARIEGSAGMRIEVAEQTTQRHRLSAALPQEAPGTRRPSATHLDNSPWPAPQPSTAGAGHDPQEITPMSDTPDDLAGKTLFRVTYSRTDFCDLYIYATDRNAALEDAEEMIGAEPSNAWYDAEVEVDHVQPVVVIPAGKTAWSGGPDGREVAA